MVTKDRGKRSEAQRHRWWVNTITFSHSAPHQTLTNDFPKDWLISMFFKLFFSAVWGNRLGCVQAEHRGHQHVTSSFAKKIMCTWQLQKHIWQVVNIISKEVSCSPLALSFQETRRQADKRQKRSQLTTVVVTKCKLWHWYCIYFCGTMEILPRMGIGGNVSRRWLGNAIHPQECKRSLNSAPHCSLKNTESKGLTLNVPWIRKSCCIEEASHSSLFN